MTDEELHERAKEDVANLVESILVDLRYFADKYHYELDWVYDEFKTQFNNRK